jgi:ribosomal protein L20A (L18A)
MKKFIVKGKYNKNGEQKFEKMVNAENEENAKEKILSLIGGKQKIIRRNITINEVISQ